MAGGGGGLVTCECDVTLSNELILEFQLKLGSMF